MCSKPIVNTVARVVSAGVTLGGSEIARNNLSKNNPINKILQAPGTIFTAGQGSGTSPTMFDKPPALPTPEAPSPTETEAPPEPGAPGATNIEGLVAKRRRKLSRMQQGLLSTIGTSASGLVGPALVSTPTAGGIPPKLKLGV